MAPQKLKYFMTGQSINVSNGTGATRPTQTVFPKVSVGKTFKLSKLPAEIQDMIFKELLVMPGSILITTHIYAVDTAAHLIRTLPFVNTGLKPTQRTPLHLKIYGKTVIIQEDVVSIFLASKAINHVCTIPTLEDLASLPLGSRDINRGPLFQNHILTTSKLTSSQQTVDRPHLFQEQYVFLQKLRPTPIFRR